MSAILKPMTKIITIDGPAASGKGTLARRLADHLDYFYLDTGKIYRLIGLEAAKKNLIPEEDGDAIVTIAQKMADNFTMDLLDNPELKSDLAGQMASRSSQFPSVRNAVLELQRSLATTPPNAKQGAVLDGRDCGTVICPQAIYKFFILADVDVRAKRRFDELQSNGDDTPYDDILNDMKMRDNRDTKRTTAPLKPADDAIIIDTSMMDADQAFDTVLETIKQPV